MLLEAQEQGLIPADYPVTGFADLVRMDGNQESRQSFTASWAFRDWGASLSAFRIGSFYQSSLTLTDDLGNEVLYVIPAMTTVNASADYTFRWADSSARVRLGVNNLGDERAPLADRFFGYFADAHRDLGRYYYLDLRLNFQ